MLWLLSVALAAPEVVVPRAPAPPVIDGALDEPAWALAPPVTEFLRFNPSAGGPPPGRTEVRFLQDDTTLYVGVRVTGSAVPIRARVSPREQIDSDDQVGLYLDPFHDARSGYIFYFNALGIQQDIRFDNGEWDVSWATVYRSKGRVDEDRRGYTLEIAIPFRSLKYPADQRTQHWGVMVTRKIPAEGAKYGFPLMVRGHPRVFRQAATLADVRPPSRGSGVELIPGLTLRMEQTRPPGEDALAWTDLDPWHDPIRPSVDVRVGLSPNVGLVGTINPDFSQVESDVPAVVLNRRFAFRFPEQRPFFTEGANFLVDDADTLYTRSIVEPLYGLKLGGREGQWSIGVLHALDRSPSPSVNERGTTGFGPDEIDGRWAFNTLLRIRHDLPGAGQVGITWGDKRLVPARFATEDLVHPVRGAADNFGLDLTVPVGQRWTVRARHDQSLISAPGDLSGGTASALGVERASGEGLGLSAQAAFVSADYRQELGFRTQSGFVDAALDLDWTLATDGIVSTYTPGLTGWSFREVTGDHYDGVGMTHALLLDGVQLVTFGGGYTHRREDLAGERFVVPGWYADLGWDGQIGAAVELTATVGGGREMDFTDLTATTRLSTRIDAALRPVKPLRVDVIGRYNRFDREVVAAEVPDVRHDLLVRARVLWQIDTKWGVRVITAYNPITGRPATLESSAMVTWLLHPFTAVYAGFAELDELGPAARTVSRSVFLKAHVWWRP